MAVWGRVKKNLEEKNICGYLLGSSLCVWRVVHPIPVCGERHKSSEGGRSRAARAARKSLAWTAGGNRERERRRMDRVRNSTGESAAASRTARHGNKYPSSLDLLALPPLLPGLQRLLQLQWIKWCPFLMHVFPFPRQNSGGRKAPSSSALLSINIHFWSRCSSRLAKAADPRHSLSLP